MARGKRFHDKFLFNVEAGLSYAGFHKVSGLKATVEVHEHWEGGSLIPDKSPGKAKFDNVTLERGATTDMDLYNWFSEVIDASGGTDTGDGISRGNDEYKRDIRINQKGRDGQVIKTWLLHGAFPIEFEAGDWDNSSNDKVIEKVVLAYDYYKLYKKA